MLRLSTITLSGTMQGPIWWPTGAICEMDFSQDFMPPNCPHSPWALDWTSLDDALQSALASGDFQGGMGDLVCGQITFTLCGDGREVRISKPLEGLAAAQDYLAPACASCHESSCGGECLG